ncbi:glycosyltransferase [Lunatibacter salilacus]|uniref:glycosyltransferase n=1 Tax=Lunatibacter salilacus TaxID=2483804 RepID=UPI00131C30A7|nr:glycosyltransferase family 2 protein [Lunatibacter salilacus]
MRQLLDTYTRRFLVNPPYIDRIPDPTLGLIVVIPSFKEPDILPTLASLASCDPPKGSLEIFIIVNAPEGSDTKIIIINQKTVDQIENWITTHCPPFMKIFIIREEKLPIKFAGAGLARKIGMDEALRRWCWLDKDGPILCLDADCTVSKNYFTAAEKSFENMELIMGHFEFCHDWENETNSMLRQGIIEYELHLRCHILGLANAGYPFAVHTVGSCMSVRASAYAKAGGMNRRKAGEDFYFMHKLLPLGGFEYIPATVYPSCRISDRVPFGTGRAQWEWMTNRELRTTYSSKIYLILKEFFKQVSNWYIQEVSFDNLNPEVAAFLLKHRLKEKINQMKQQSKSHDVFFRRFWQWMDGFMVLKLVHYLRDNGFTNQPVLIVAEDLIREIENQKIKGLIQSLNA